MQLTRSTIRELITEEISKIMSEQDAAEEEVATVSGDVPAVDLDAMTGDALKEAVRLTVLNSISNNAIPQALVFTAADSPTGEEMMEPAGKHLSAPNPLERYLTHLKYKTREAGGRDAAATFTIEFMLSSDSLTVIDVAVSEVSARSEDEVASVTALLEDGGERFKQSVNAAAIVPNYVGDPIKLSPMRLRMPWLI